MQQQALRDFDQALRNWWAGSHRRPRWRKKGHDEGFCVRDVSVRRLSRKWAELQVPKVGWVRFRLTRPLGAHGMSGGRPWRARRHQRGEEHPRPGAPGACAWRDARSRGTQRNATTRPEAA